MLVPSISSDYRQKKERQCPCHKKLSLWSIRFWIVWFLFLVLMLPTPAYAYLDPGTGSMLLSALVGIAATLFFMVKSFYYKAAGVFFRLTGVSAPAGTSKDIVIYSEGSQYWNTFKPVIAALDAMGHKTVYLTSDEKDPGLEYPTQHGTTRYIGTGSRAFAVLNMLEADICVLTTPGLDVLQIHRSPGVKHYTHLVHSMTDMAIYKLFSFDYFDSVLCAGPHQIRSLRHLENLRSTPQKTLLETGCPYMDVLADTIEEKEIVLPEKQADAPLRLLVAPTWGQNGLLTRFGLSLLEPLAQSGHLVTIRPHPQSFVSESALMQELQNSLASYDNVSWDKAPNGLSAMLASDILISDLSGIVFDYAFVLERPVITVHFTPDTRGLEAGDLPWPAWELGILPELGAQIEPKDIRDLPAVIASLPDPTPFKERVRSLRKESLFNYRASGHIAAQQLLRIKESLQ